MGASILDIFLIMLKVSFLSFGGSAPLPLLQDEFSRQRGLLTDRDFASAVAIGRITPGPNGLFVIPVGYFLAGVPGALVAALAICVPSMFVLLLLKGHGRVAHLSIVQGATRAVIAATIGLMTGVGYSLTAATVHNLPEAGIAGVTFLALVLTKVDAVVVIGGAGLAGLLMSALRG